VYTKCEKHNDKSTWRSMSRFLHTAISLSTEQATVTRTNWRYTIRACQSISYLLKNTLGYRSIVPLVFSDKQKEIRSILNLNRSWNVRAENFSGWRNFRLWFSRFPSSRLHRIYSVFVKVKGETFAPFRASCFASESHFSRPNTGHMCACHALSITRCYQNLEI